MIPRVGDPPQTGLRHRRRPGAYAILWRGGRVLLTRQAQPVPEFQLPGGGVDPGEQPLAALHREVREETGYRIGPARHLGIYRRFCLMPEYGIHAEKLCHVWLARPVTRLGPPSEPGHEAHWLDPGRALDLLADPGSRRVLGAFLAMVGQGPIRQAPIRQGPFS